MALPYEEYPLPNVPTPHTVVHFEGDQMTTDELERRLKEKRAVIAGNAAALAHAYRMHEQVEAALNEAVAWLSSVADSQELADDLVELEDLRGQIWEHLFVDSKSQSEDRMTMRIG